MGFGFNLFFIFIFIPLLGILLLVWLISKKQQLGILLGGICLGVLGLSILLGFIQFLTSKKDLDKEDYYGAYIINRDYFKGQQADWQYNHFRFEITKEDSIFFYVTEEEKILETYRGTIKTTEPGTYSSARLIINMEQPGHHILTSNPTSYRAVWDFYLVLKSPKFHNMFFQKGKWKSIE